MAPPSSPTWSTWWSFTSSTEECCPASSNTPAPLWPCDTLPLPQHHTLFFAHLSPGDPPFPFAPSPDRHNGAEETEKGYVSGDVTNTVGAGIGGLMSPMLCAFLCFTAVWMFEWDNPECFKLWTAVAQLLRRCHGDWLFNYCCGERPHLVKRQDGYSHIFPAGVLWVSWMDPSLRAPNPSTPPTAPILQAW